jgi:hypothetical protein
MTLDDLVRLAGIKEGKPVNTDGINISVTGTEKGQLMKKHHIEPGTPEWFQLWFSRPKLTCEKPIGK